MKEKNKRNSFKGSIGFVMAAAGSAVGLGNIWRFPYLAAKDGGGVFLAVYIVLALTFGFTLLTTEITIGRKTRQSPLTAYSRLKRGWGFLGIISCVIPAIIMPYYCAIGGWVIKYFMVFITGKGAQAAGDDYFSGYISKEAEPIILMAIFLAVTAYIVFRGVNKGIESFSKVIMPVLFLMIIGISVFSFTISYTDAQGITRNGIEGFKIYLIPDFTGMTVEKFINIFIDALGQLFFSLSVAMGIMVAYGSYVKDDDNIGKSINRIEIFDTAAALFAGAMIIPAVYVFMGTEGMSQGPGLMFVSLPKIFDAMGAAGTVIGCIFFAMVLFAAFTSAVSIMEAVVSSLMDKFGMSRKKACVIEAAVAFVFGIIVCLGYNKLYFEFTLPNGATAQILDIMDYLSNNCLMPIVAFGTCILIGWIVKPKTIIDEVEKTGHKFGRKRLYIVMIKFLAPLFLLLLLMKTMLPS